jgi:hypothetical protein
MHRRKVSPPSSGFKYMPIKKPAEAFGKLTGVRSALFITTELRIWSRTRCSVSMELNRQNICCRGCTYGRSVLHPVWFAAFRKDQGRKTTARDEAGFSTHVKRKESKLLLQHPSSFWTESRTQNKHYFVGFQILDWNIKKVEPNGSKYSPNLVFSSFFMNLIMIGYCHSTVYVDFVFL